MFQTTVNINSAAAFMKPWCIQTTTATTDNVTVQPNILHLFLTIPKNLKEVSMEISVETGTQTVLYTNSHSIKSSRDKITIFRVCFSWHEQVIYRPKRDMTTYII